MLEGLRSTPRGLRGPALSLLACALAACHPSATPAAPAGNDLAGLTVRLSASEPRLAARGQVADVPAEVSFDLASPLTTVTTGCFPDGPRVSNATVRVPRPEGGHAALPQAPLPISRLGDARLVRLTVGLVPGRECVLALGSDVLGRYALDVEPARGELRVLPSRPRDAYAREVAAPPVGEDAFLLELSKDPSGDWPLVSAELRQGDARLAGTFVLSTREPRSSLDVALAGRAGFLPEAGEARAETYAFDALALAPGLELTRARLMGERGWRNPGAAGVLGADVWGHFHATFDVGAGVAVLRRPRAAGSGPTPPPAPRPHRLRPPPPADEPEPD